MLLKVSIVLWCIFLASTNCSPLINRERVSIAPTAAGDEYRLPTSIQPTHYTITLHPNLVDGSDFKFYGEVVITIHVVENTNSITFHIDDLEIIEDSIRLTNTDTGVDVDILEPTQNVTLNFYTLPLEEELQSGEEYELRIEYYGYHRDDMRGFYRSSYVNKDGKKVWLGSTHFEPVRARRAFPCFDEPALKAKFQVNFNHTPDFTTVLTNMPCQEEEQEDTDLVLTVCEETPMPMSTYLVAFVVSEFEGTANEKVTVYHRPDISSQAKYSADISPPILKVMEDFTEVEYFLPKMDEIAVPDFSAGAMENYALVTYRERMILFEEGVSASNYRQSIATVIAHEFAHQWFGDLVGPHWWKYLWLNEGFATYFEFFATAEVEKDWRLPEQFVIDAVHNALSADASLSSHPMTYDVYNPTQIGNMFDSISYDKAGCVIRMMEHIVGHNSFRLGLKRYLLARENNTAEDFHLFEALKSQYEEDNFPNGEFDVNEVFISWARQTGYPVINVARDYSAGTVTVSQSRFLLTGTEPTETRWYVPLTWTTKTDLSFEETAPKDWLTQTEKEKTLSLDVPEKDWIIFNIQETGFYRVNYDSNNWQLLINYLNLNDYTKIPPVNRAQLLNDAFNLVRAGLLDYTTAFNLAAYLERETDYIPWYAALSAFSYINTRLKGLENNEYEVFKQHLLKLLNKVIEEVGFDERETDDHVTKLKRNLVSTWACNLGHQGCINTAIDKFNSFVSDPVNNYVTPDLQTFVYCNGLRNTQSNQGWKLLWNRFLETQVSTEQVLILSILGCSADETLVHEYLLKYVSGESTIRSQDISLVLSSVINNRNEKFLVSFVDVYYEQLKTNYGGVNTVKSLIRSASSAITSQSLYDELSKIVDKYSSELGETSDTLLSSAKSNIAWANTNKDIIVNWIRVADYRLPTHLTPVAYILHITPDFETFTFDGEVSIRVTVEEETNKIVFHASNMTFIKTTIMSVSHLNSLPIENEYEDSAKELHIIDLKDMMTAGEQYTITITYVGHMLDDMYGFYKSYYNVGNEQRWLGSTQFEPTSARRAFPCFDEPAFKATFKISIGRPKGYNSISNAPKLNTQQHETKPDYEWDNFDVTPKMSTYLVAFVVSDFTQVTNEDGTMSIWQRSDAEYQASYSISVSKDIINYLEQYTGVDYELSKMDQAAIPDFSAGAMENWGLVTYRERLILFDEKVSTTSNKQSIATVIAHEFAHQWFGDLVSPAWWKYLWLNEGFATYFEYFGTAQVETDWRLEEQFVVRELQGAFSSDALNSSHPMSHDVTSPAEINSIFDSISYSKAGSVIRMMKHFLTENTFKNGLNRYLNNRHHAHAEEDHLFGALHDQHKEDLAETPEQQIEVTNILKTWTNQKGYPLITVTRDYDNNRATVTQKRFLLKENPESTDEHDYKWHVPLAYTAKSNPDFTKTEPTHWFPETSEQLTITNLALSSDWVIFNPQQTGYYRVNYDNQNWKLIHDHLNSDSFRDIHVLNRAQLIDDALNLARSGILDYSLALDVTKYLNHEDDYIPWYSTFNALSFLNIRLSGATTEEYQLFKDYVVKQLTNIYVTLGFDVQPNDSHTTKLLRTNVLTWACNFELGDCVSTAREKFNAFKNNPETAILHPDITSVVYCTALKYGTKEDWDFLLNKFKTSNVGTEQVLLLSALGCATDVETINSYLELSITPDSGIRKQDTASVFSAVYTNARGLDMAFDFLTRNYEKISEFYGGMNAIANTLTGIASRLSSREQYNKLKQFIDENEENLGNALAASRRALETVEENLVWLDKHHDTIITWLQSALNPDGSTSTEGFTSSDAPPTVTDAPPPDTDSTPTITDAPTDSTTVTDPTTTSKAATFIKTNQILFVISVILFFRL